MSEFAWRNVLLLPENHDSGWCIYKRGVYHESTAEVAKECALKWLPASPILFGAPGASKLMPPTEIAELKNSAKLALRRQYLNASTATVGCAVVFIALTLLYPHSLSFLALSVALVSLWGVISFDYFVYLRHRQPATERALFYYWLRTNPGVRMAGMYCIIFMMLLGSTQLILQGGVKNGAAFNQIGALYKSLAHGQYWRLLTGPYLHYSLTHFANNFFLLLVMSSAATGIIGRHTLYVFVIGNFLSGWAQWVFGAQVLGSFGGISGGVYALYGVLLGIGIKYRGLFPKGLLFSFMAVGALGVLSTDFVSKTSASVAHVTGFCFGLVYGLVVRPAPKVFSGG